MIGQAVEDLRRRQPITLQLLLHVVMHELSLSVPILGRDSWSLKYGNNRW
jgi:hypothetical protein